MPPYFQHYYGTQDPPENDHEPSQSTTNVPTRLPLTQVSGNEQQLIYNLKIINPKRKSQFKVEKLRKCGKFRTPMEMRLHIISEFEELVPRTTEFDIGYYKPSRGSTKVWIKSDEDMQCMYDGYKYHHQELNIWCEGHHDHEDTEKDSVDTSTRKKHKIL